MEDLSTMGTSIEWSEVRVGDEVWCSTASGSQTFRGRIMQLPTNAKAPWHMLCDGSTYYMGATMPVRLIRRANPTPPEDVSTMGTPTTWDAVGVGDEVVALIYERWRRGTIGDHNDVGWALDTIDEGRWWAFRENPVRLLTRASDPITTGEDLPRDTSAPDCAGLDDVAGLAEGVTRAVARAAAVTAAVGAIPLEAEPEEDPDTLQSLTLQRALREAHALRLAIREVCGMTEDEPDEDLAARLRERVTGLRDTANTLNNQLAEADGEIKSLTYRMDEIEALVEAAAVLSREPVYPISKAVRVALLRSVRA
jgi:hypothetical protein